MCHARDFNLLHASPTSAQALSTLCKLPTTNLTLHQEISTTTTNINTYIDKVAFSIETHDDGSDIPIDVVRSAVTLDGVIM
jgi:hypothetical protein